MKIERAVKNSPDFTKLRADFPILKQMNRGKPLIYLDSAASAQKPVCVVQAVNDFYLQDYANIHRGIYELSERATEIFETARLTIANFIHADPSEIIFTSGTTESINLVAQSYGSLLKAGDEIILSTVEHHANIVPWDFLKEQKGIHIKIIPVNEDGSLSVADFQTLLSERTKLIAISHVSNALGTINPVEDIIGIAKTHNIPVLLDGAQAAPHLPLNVKKLDCDFYAFSSHKVYGPTGIGVLFAKKHYQELMPPYQGGGDMITTVAFDQITYAKGPQKFEAGTQNLSGIVGFAKAVEYLQQIGMDNLIEHEQQLLNYATAQLETIDGLKIIGTARPKIGLISFVMSGIHPHDLGTVLDNEGIAVRAGHHCAMPLMARFKVPATVRVSFGLYTSQQDIDVLIKGILLAKRIFA